MEVNTKDSAKVRVLEYTSSGDLLDGGKVGMNEFMLVPLFLQGNVVG